MKVVYTKDGKIRVKSPDGTSSAIDKSLYSYYANQGFKLETPEEANIRNVVEDSDNLMGSIGVGVDEFTNQLLMGIPEIIKQKRGDPLDVAYDNAIKKEHKAAQLIGGGLGFAGSLAVGGPLFKGAAKGGQIAEKALQKVLTDRIKATGVKKGAEATARNIAAKTLDTAAKWGTEGAILSTPYAVTEAALAEDGENPFALAAESLAAGGLLGATLGVGLKGAKPFASMTGQVAKKVSAPLVGEGGIISRKFSPANSAMELLGPTPLQETKFIKKLRNKWVDGRLQRVSEKEAKEDVLRFLKDDIGLSWDEVDAGTLQNKIQTYMDDVLLPNANTLVNDVAVAGNVKNVFAPIVKKLDDRINELKTKFPGFSEADERALNGIRQKAETFIESFGQGEISAGNLWGLRKYIRDQKNNLFRQTNRAKTEEVKALETLYFDLDNSIADLLEKGATGAGQEWKDTMRKYSMAIESENLLARKLPKDEARMVVSPSNIIRGSAGYFLGGPIGAAITTASSPIFKDYRNYGIIYAEDAMKKMAQAMDKIPKAINSQISKARGLNVGSNPKEKALFTATRILGDTQEERHKEYERIRDRTAQLANDPQYMASQLGEVNGIFQNTGAPQIGNEFVRKNVVMNEYISSITPKSPRIDKPYYKPKYVPTDVEMSHFERRLRVIRDPMSIVEDLERGTLTPQAVETFQNVYPRIFERFQQRVLETLMDTKQDIPYETRLQLSLIIEDVTDPSLENIANFQKTYQPKEAHGDTNPKVPGFKVKDLKTNVQRITDR